MSAPEARHVRLHRSGGLRQRTILLAALIAAMIPALGPAVAAGDFDSRPVETRELLPPYIPFLNPVPERAELLRPGVARLTVSISNSNSWAGTDHFRSLAAPAPGVRIPIDRNLIDTYRLNNPDGDLFLVDAEVLWTDLIFRIGVNDRLELGIDVPVIRYSGGFLDKTIESFHSTFGFPSDGRPAFEKDRFNLELDFGSTEYFVDGVPDPAGIGDVTLSARVPLWEDPATGRFVSAAGYLKLPTGDAADLFGSGNADYGGQVFYTHQRKRQAWHLSGGFAILGDWDFAPEIHPDDVLFGSGTYEYLMVPACSVVAQMGVTMSPFRGSTDEDLEDPSTRVNAGFRWYFRSGLTFEALLEENAFFTNASADFGLHIAASWRFGSPARD